MASPLTLSGKVAIVTGSSRGLGAGIALELARRGAKVTIVYTSPSSETSAHEVASRVATFDNGSQAIVVRADLKDANAPQHIVAATVQAFGEQVDILVNNAGVLFEKTVLDITPGDFDDIFSVNVRAPLLMIKAVVPRLRAPGRIINLSSAGARSGFERLSLYCASKAALEGLTRSLATELGHQGHTVNCVAPGPVDSTDMVGSVPPEVIEMQLKTTAVQHRLGTVDDIVQVVAWLSEESSRWISGQSIAAGGGIQML